MFECTGSNGGEMVMTGSFTLRKRNGQKEPDEKWLYADLISKGHFSLKRLHFDRTHP